MTQKLAIRVGVGPNGKTERELLVEGQKICELSYVEVLEFAMQAVSSLRDWTGKEQETMGWRR